MGTDVSMTAVAVRPPTTVPAGEWNLMDQQARALAASDIIPRAYFRKPANVLVAAITGRHYGWDVLTAMRNGHVIEGSWGMKPEAMLGLVRQAGHSVKGEMTATGASVTGTRADTGDSMTISFTLDDAVRAGLVQLKNGQPWARSSSGKPLPWEQYPAVMCYWRAIGLLCRVLFSDITAGVYTAEELGAAISADGDVIEGEVVDTPSGPMPLSEDALAAFRKACEEAELGPVEVLASAFPDGVPDELTDDHLPTMRDAYRRLVEARAMEAAPDESNVGTTETRPATRTQVGKVKGEYARLGVEDREAQLDSTARIIGRTIPSHNALNFDEAAAVIHELVNREPGAEPQLDLDGGGDG